MTATRIPAVRTRRDPLPGGLAELIVKRRAILGLSHNGLGEAAGIHGTLSWQIEVGKSVNPKVLVLYGLSVALRVPFSRVCKAALIDALAREKL